MFFKCNLKNTCSLRYKIVKITRSPVCININLEISSLLGIRKRPVASAPRLERNWSELQSLTINLPSGLFHLVFCHLYTKKDLFESCTKGNHLHRWKKRWKNDGKVDVLISKPFPSEIDRRILCTYIYRRLNARQNCATSRPTSHHTVITQESHSCQDHGVCRRRYIACYIFLSGYQSALHYKPSLSPVEWNLEFQHTVEITRTAALQTTQDFSSSW